MFTIEPLRKFLIITVFFIFFSHVFSPSSAETEIITENNAFLTPKPIKRVLFLTVTGYSSSPDETDEDPWITAYNTIARDGIVASNILPFRTKIRIPSLFGDKIFVVEDKMHSRYDENIDVWFPSKQQAKEFGIHRDVLVEILE